MNIPLIDYRDDLDCCSRKYRRAIYNTLLTLKPKYCLEIGSYLFQSSSVFSRYFDEHNQEGKLITCDIAKWSASPPPPYVRQIMFYPHIANITDNHGGIDVYYKDFVDKISKDDSLNLNSAILSFETGFDGYNMSFDLTFVDGDHSAVSFKKDLQLAQWVTHRSGYILIDDIYDQNHPEQIEIYNQLKENGNVFYEFEDWEVKPGMALIQNKDLKLNV